MRCEDIDERKDGQQIESTLGVGGSRFILCFEISLTDSSLGVSRTSCDRWSELSFYGVIGMWGACYCVDVLWMHKYRIYRRWFVYNYHWSPCKYYRYPCALVSLLSEVSN